MLTRRESWRIFVASEQPRVRRASDAVVAVVSLAWLAVLGLLSIPSPQAEKSLAEVLSLPPGWFDFLWRLLIIGLMIWPAVIALACAATRRWAELRDVVLAALLGSAAGLVSNRVVSGSWDSGLVLFGADPVRSYPVVVVGLAAAVIAVARPHLTRPYRRLGSLTLSGGVLGMLLMGSTLPIGALIGLLVGSLSAACIHLALGTQDGVPSRAEAAATVAALGSDVVGLQPARRQDAGVYVFDGTSSDGEAVSVRLYGRDARDTQLLSTIWRALWYRAGSAPALGRSHRAEHEAFVTLRLRDCGLPAPAVLAAGGLDAGDAAVVLSGRGVSFEDVASRPGAEAPDDLAVGEQDIRDCWRLLSAVHDCGLAVGELGPSTFMLRSSEPPAEQVAGGRVMLDQLVGATSAPSDADLRSDEARLLVMSALLLESDADDDVRTDISADDGADDVGDGGSGDAPRADPENDLPAPARFRRVIELAHDELGTEALTSLLGYLQPAALGSQLRSDLHGRKVKVADLRAEVATHLGVEEPEIAKLRRVSLASVVKLVVIAALAYLLVTRLAEVDFSEIVSEFAGADWTWIVVALVLGQMAIASQSVVTQGAAPQRVAYGPLVLLQFAVAFIMLAVPSSAARIAMVVRFFQRQGVPASAAVSISLLDSFTGFLVQVAVLVITLVFGVGGVQLHLSGTGSSVNTSNLVTALVVLAVVAVLAVLIAAFLRRTREWVLAKVREPVSEMWSIAKGVRTPRRLLQLFGGNFVTELLFGLCLGASALAFGGASSGLAGAMVVYIAAALFGGFMPVPGGVGVMEAALTAGLSALGMDSGAALGAALAFRAITFYLPPVWGAAATGWLRRQGDL